MSVIEIKEPKDLQDLTTVETGDAYTFKLHRFQVHWLEFEDTLFHHDSAVLMPDGLFDDEKEQHSGGLDVIYVAYSYASENADQQLLIAGHTDTSGSDAYNETLSLLRAENILYVMLGDQDAWVDSVLQKSKVEDYQQILTWVAYQKGWPCDPQGIDNVSGANTRSAIRKFQEYYNLEFDQEISVDGGIGPETWGAIFQLYMDYLKYLANTDDAGLDELRNQLNWLYDDLKRVGCGEYHPVDHPTSNNRKSQSNRRIELLFFPPGQEPKSKPGDICHSGGKAGTKDCLLYNGLNDYEPIPYIPPQPRDNSKYDQIRWWYEIEPEEPTGVQVVYSNVYSEEQVGIALREGITAQLELRQFDYKEAVIDAIISIEFEREDQKGTFVKRDLAINMQINKLVYVDLPFEVLIEVFEELEGELHKTWLRCHIPETNSHSGGRKSSLNLAFPVLQRPLYFLPGVMGSTLSVINHNGDLEEAWPEVSVYGDKEIDLLVSKSDGTPHREAVREELLVLDNVFHEWASDIYSCIERVAEVQESFPEVFIDAAKEKRLEPAIYKEIPYDWRLNISKSHLDIAQEIRDHFDGIDPSGMPFLHNKISIAGHSTGGVIMRGFTYSNNAIKDIIEHFFFINVPHLGAPKAEYVYFSGDMEIPIVAVESFRQMGPDMPILYFLTACSRYGTAVGSGVGNMRNQDWTPAARQQRVQDAINAGAYDTTKIALYGYPQYATEGPLTYNMPLALAADKHCEDSAAAGPNTPIESFVFHSGGLPTISSTTLEDTTVLANKTLVGDGTVPTVSQIGDIGSWANATLFNPTPGNPAHVPAPNEIWIWERIFDVITKTNIEEHTRPFPTDMKETADLLFEIARDVYGEGWYTDDIKDSEESLSPGTPRTITHSDQDCSIALIECLEGSLKVEASYKNWVGFNPLESLTINQGQYILIEIPDRVTGDQTNRIILSTTTSARYKLNMISVNV